MGFCNPYSAVVTVKKSWQQPNEELNIICETNDLLKEQDFQEYCLVEDY